jgi:tape measure domain-containing protein
MAGTVNLKSKISLDDSAFVSGIKRAQRTVAAFAGKASAAFKSVGGSIAKAATRMKNFAAIIAKISLVGIGAGFAAAGVAAAKLLKSGSGIAAEYETIRLTMGAYLKDLGMADTILRQISKFSVVTPFETTGLQEAANTLLGAGIAGGDVVDVLKEIAAVSKTTGQVGELADALAKGFSKGKFQTEELNKFLERGINLHPELQKQIGKTGDAYGKAVQAGLGFEDVRSAIAAMSAEGGLFFGMIKTQSTTFSGLISTLSSNWDEFLLKFGQPINDSLKPLLEIFISQVQKLTESGKQIGEIISRGIDGVVKKINGVDFVGLGQKFIAGLNIERAKELLLGAMKVAAAFLGNKLVEAMRFAAHLGEVAFTYIFDKITGDFGRNLAKATRAALFPTYEELENGISSAVDSGMSLDEQMIAAADSFKQKVKTDADPFGFQYAVKQFQKSLDGVMQGGGKKAASESDLYEKELEEQRARIKRDEEAAREAKNKATAEAARKQVQIALMQAEAARMGATPLQVSQTATKMAESHKAGFTGLTGLYQMQMQKAQGIGVGETTRFAKDRSRLGIASGLQSGGIGSKRYINPAREAARIAKEQKKDTREQIEVLRDVDRKLGQGLLAQ